MAGLFIGSSLSFLWVDLLWDLLWDRLWDLLWDLPWDLLWDQQSAVTRKQKYRFILFVLQQIVLIMFECFAQKSLQKTTLVFCTKSSAVSTESNITAYKCEMSSSVNSSKNQFCVRRRCNSWAPATYTCTFYAHRRELRQKAASIHCKASKNVFQTS